MPHPRDLQRVLAADQEGARHVARAGDDQFLWEQNEEHDDFVNSLTLYAQAMEGVVQPAAVV
jgi:hypothetical protein